MASLTIQTGGSPGEVRPLAAGPFTIGRLESCSLRLSDDRVSREHCRIWFDPADRVYKIADEGSANGTLVDGEKVRGERVLRGGEVIAVGSTVIRFEHDSPAWDFADYFPEVEVRLSGYRIRQPIPRPEGPPAGQG